ncbi:hypothetical protein [Chelativorans sp. YIM 93263]|uniref:hypothetical protein n=1 Tax=Chelativorans sp. YIM 93263 TaxID=2906648 RepID=UPI0023787429|nr:hypothetical protein [Chelativorans sp. YIM 93263]
MTVRPSPRLEERAREIAVRMLPQIQQMVLHEMAELSVPKGEAEIMRACRRVGEAADRLEQAKYTPEEIRARREVERAAKALGTVMAKHGRMP